jgi:hypothetical protein
MNRLCGMRPRLKRKSFRTKYNAAGSRCPASGASSERESPEDRSYCCTERTNTEINSEGMIVAERIAPPARSRAAALSVSRTLPRVRMFTYGPENITRSFDSQGPPHKQISATRVLRRRLQHVGSSFLRDP